MDSSSKPLEKQFLQDICPALGYPKGHSSRNYDYLVNITREFYNKYEERYPKLKIPPHSRQNKESEAARICASYFLFKSGHGEKLWPPTHDNGILTWSRNQKFIVPRITRIFTCHALYKHQKNLKHQKMDGDGNQESPRKRCHSQEDFSPDCEIQTLDPEWSLRPWLSPAKRIGRFKCTTYIESLKLGSPMPEGFTLELAAEDDSPLPPSVDSIIQRYMHQNSFYPSKNTPDCEHKFDELIMQLLGGAELYSQLDVTQLDNLRSKVLDKAKAFVEDFAKSLYIQCGSDGRFRKSYRFKQIWRQHFDSESDEPLEEEDQSEERETRRNRLIETAKKARELYSDEGDTIIVRQKDLPEDVHWEVAEPMQTDTISRKVPSSKTLSHEMPDPAASVEEVYNNCASPPKNLLIAKPPVKIISRPPIVDKSMPEVSNVLPGETSSQLSGTSCLKIPPSLSPNEPCDPNPSKIHSNAQSPTLGASGPAPFSPQTASKERLAPTGRGMQMLGSGHRSSFTHIEDEDCYITSEILRKPGEPSNTTSNHSTQPKMNWSTPTPTTITVVKTHGALKQKTRRSSRTPRPSTRLRPKPPIITTPHLTQMSDPRTALPDPGSKHQRPISPPTSLHSVDTAQLFYGEEAVTRNYKSSHNQSTMAEPSVQTASTPDPADPAQSAFMAVQTPRPSSSHFPSLQDSGVISHNEELPEIGSVSPSPIRAQVHRTRQETLHPLQGQTIQGIQEPSSPLTLTQLEMGTKSLVDNTMAKSPPVVKPTLVASPPRKFDIKQSSTTYTDTITLCLLLQRENGAFEFEADPLLIPLEEFQKYTVPEIFSLYARNSDMPLERLHCLTIFATFSNYETLVVREDDGEDKWEMAKKKLKKLVMFERKKDMSITDFEIWMRFSD